jgi:phosphatidylinositol-3-phosphatase
MRIRKKVAIVVSGAVLVGTASLLASLPSGLQAGAVKALSAPVFVGSPSLKATVGKPYTHTLKTKANPVATLSVTTSLPSGVSVQLNNPAGTATVTDPTPLGGGPYTFTLKATNSQGTTDQVVSLTVKSKLPLIRHVFVIMMENEGYAATFGGANNYLNSTLPAQGALLTNYYGVGHFSNSNYTGFISGQPPTADNQIDCLATPFYADFPSGSGQDASGIQQGNGCIYPTAVPTLADQLGNDGLTWKGYEEDMGNIPTREAANCGHPAVNGSDGTAAAVPGDAYASRHDPFVYFHSIIDSPECNQNVVPLGDSSGNLPATALPGTTGLATDLLSTATTPNFSFITPNLCNDGHDYPCHNVTSPDTSGVNDISDWLQTWVPIIKASPAYQQDGLIEVTFDEAGGSDATACCGETPGPAANPGGNGGSGPGGGKIGTILISPSITPGAVITKTSYNHYSSLASIEDLFGLPHLGEAKTVTTTFDKGIYIKP